jgi:exonuclease SbcD
MILFFSDAHLGVKTHSIQDEFGIYSAEYDTMVALDYIAQRAASPDIEMVLFGGDMTHTNNPTPSIIDFLIRWFQTMDSIGIPVYLITGNHDTSMYSNSLIYTNTLKLKNIHLYHKLDSIESIKWNDWEIKFVPYVPNKSLKDKDYLIDNSMLKAVDSSSTNTMILSHLQESGSRIGSEGRMLARGVPILNTNFYKNKKLLFLLGHMHMHQIYGTDLMKVVYPGSTTYIDSTDIGIKKGYCLIDKDGNISFEEIKGIRKFIRYSVPDSLNPIDYLRISRILSNSVVFIDYFYDEKINIKEIYKFFKEKNCLVGEIKKRPKLQCTDSNNIFMTNKKTPQETFIDFVTNFDTTLDKQQLLKKGLHRLEKIIEEIK